MTFDQLLRISADPVALRRAMQAQAGRRRRRISARFTPPGVDYQTWLKQRGLEGIDRQDGFGGEVSGSVLLQDSSPPPSCRPQRHSTVKSFEEVAKGFARLYGGCR